MSSIPVAGLAKALTVVTILLHPAAHHGPASYTVRAGDTLWLDVAAAQTGGGAEKGRVDLVLGIAMRRLGHPSDIANGVLFFAAERSGWVTGQVIAIDGGSALL